MSPSPTLSETPAPVDAPSLGEPILAQEVAVTGDEG
jgi:hypothetical protein